MPDQLNPEHSQKADLLKITIIQSDLFWEDKSGNLDAFTKKLSLIRNTDLIILPEMFSTGFSMRSKELAENMNGPVVAWMKLHAKEKNAVITGSFICEEEGKCYNRLVWMRPDGTCAAYDKRHLFRMGKEQEHYSCGGERIIVEYKGWRINPLICYDLRFPVWCRQPKDEKPFDLQLYVANWPERRSFAWKSLLTARAIENQCYVAGVNRVGKDGYDIIHSGDSGVYDFSGEKITSIMPGTEADETIILSLGSLQEFREKFPAALDADQYRIM